MKTYKSFAIGLIVGAMLMATVPALAAAVKQYVLVDASYPVYVNGSAYTNKELPVLNYDGNTYIPMKAVGDMLGASVSWNDAQKRAEIASGDGKPVENSAFRGVKVIGSNGNYTVTGEARVFEAVMNYNITDGQKVLLQKSYNLKEGAPTWSTFTLNIYIPQDELPVGGTLSIELFEYSAKDGSVINQLRVPLERFPS